MTMQLLRDGFRPLASNADKPFNAASDQFRRNVSSINICPGNVRINGRLEGYAKGIGMYVNHLDLKKK